jgi:uncharacterized protein with HEPN domain
VTSKFEERLVDILEAGVAIGEHRSRGPLSDGMVFDAVRVRLIKIGEAVKDLDPPVLVGEPTIPWRDIAAMHDHLAHRHFDTSHAIVQATVDRDLPALLVAVQCLLELGSDEEPA